MLPVYKVWTTLPSKQFQLQFIKKEKILNNSESLEKKLYCKWIPKKGKNEIKEWIIWKGNIWDRSLQFPIQMQWWMEWPEHKEIIQYRRNLEELKVEIKLIEQHPTSKSRTHQKAVEATDIRTRGYMESVKVRVMTPNGLFSKKMTAQTAACPQWVCKRSGACHNTPTPHPNNTWHTNVL